MNNRIKGVSFLDRVSWDDFGQLQSTVDPQQHNKGHRNTYDMWHTGIPSGIPSMRYYVLRGKSRRRCSIPLLVALFTFFWTFDHAFAIIGDQEVVLVKIGGSSITRKAEREVLDTEALDWFGDSILSAIHANYLAPADDSVESQCPNEATNKNIAFVIVHGAGSFGHFSAKKYNLRGQAEPPVFNSTAVDEHRFVMKGVAETRLSVQTLNRHVVETFVRRGINAIGISPCFGVPGLEAHAGVQLESQAMLQRVILDVVRSGLVPVLHGDACLHGPSGGGILSGDTLMEILGKEEWIDHAVFITDVDGVFTDDPRKYPEAELLRTVVVEPISGKITTKLIASGSSHEHDVTGGLAVSNILSVFLQQIGLGCSNYSSLSIQTKLKAAASVASSGTNVTIVKCQSLSAEQALRADAEVEIGSIILLK